ncbi:hypothetical protein [Streptomyces sulphureus]|uniref:hypothetical protein n=1 Tax=Streptomyces sulphureus TaxID=47758 RepID=UPI0003A1B704|nr:hypothetical protein [Streptomyces sulphureus]
MNPDLLPAIGRALRDICAYSNRPDITDATLVDLAGELHRAHRLVLQAQGRQPGGHQCARHPGGPVDPTAENGCLLCGTAARPPARPMPEGVEPGEVLRAIEQDGHDTATARYGARAVARALAIGGRHLSNPRPGGPVEPYDPDTEGDHE